MRRSNTPSFCQAKAVNRRKLWKGFMAAQLRGGKNMFNQTPDHNRTTVWLQQAVFSSFFFCMLLCLVVKLEGIDRVRRRTLSTEDV